MIREKHDLDAQAQKEHEEKFGGYNSFPPGWREISSEEYAQSIGFTYHPTMIEHRQMFNFPDGSRAEKYVSTNLEFFHDGTGTAVVADYWAQKLKFFKFGCVHEFGDARDELKRRDITLMRGEHAFYCIKCKHLSIVDSSD